MNTLTLATSLQAPLQLHAGLRLVGPEHLPDAVVAAVANTPPRHLIAWSFPEAGSVGFSQAGRHLLLPFPLLGAGIGSLQPAKGGGFVTLFVRTAEARMIDVLGSGTFQRAALDELLAHQAGLSQLLGCTVTAEDWGYDC
ncbi:hypothetical protein [Stenotrophomonas sp. 24(2023)]|uniref:hypothetical protein n=1 Tax=Stenotrophomonas sp. 24(2023) TaxID=3068324 RepID=UPI0027E1FAAD|nr:hypothetical protein [Stenotrophomonas sp. 24(2023)]WMJ68429.1 hypothetical protein Q9R17_14670 [Stenotrophomonas sp. 24(2023)]